MNRCLGSKFYTHKKKEKMTVIAVRNFKDRIEIASDSQTTREDVCWWTHDRKIVKYSDNLIVWFAGRNSHTKKLRRLFSDSPKFDSLRELDELMDWFMNLEAHIIIIKNEKIYCARFYDDGTYNSYEVKESDAVWSWEDQARIAMTFTDDMSKVIKTAIDFSTTCWGKIQKLIIKKK